MKTLHSNAHLATNGSCKHNEEEVQTGIKHVAMLRVLSSNDNICLSTNLMNDSPEVIAYGAILSLIATV